MSLRLHRPVPGGLKPAGTERADWREGLRAKRWHAARLANPEARPVSGWAAVAFFGALAALTFILLLLGYGSRFWGS